MMCICITKRPDLIPDRPIPQPSSFRPHPRPRIPIEDVRWEPRVHAGRPV